MSKTDIMKSVANMNQLCFARLCEIRDRFDEKMNIVTVQNGSGLAFDILPDRGLDIGNCFFKGTNVVYITENGYVSPKDFEETPDGFMKHFIGGLLMSCGMLNVGPFCQINGHSYGQHGSISNTPCTGLQIKSEWLEDDYVISVTADLRETSPEGTNLLRTRTISTRYNRNEIRIDDSITNLSAFPVDIMLMYHFNFGYPLIQPSSIIDFPSGTVRPRDVEAAKGFSEYNIISAPVKGYAEQVFYHEFYEDKCQVHVQNKNLRVTIGYDKTQLPKFTHWKMMDEKAYVLGIEPGLSNPVGRNNALGTDQVTRLKPNESRKHTLFVTFE